jgi:hypothetical protein
MLVHTHTSRYYLSLISPHWRFFFILRWVIRKTNLTHTDSILLAISKYIQLKVDNCILNDKHEKRFSFFFSSFLFQTIESWRTAENKIKMFADERLYMATDVYVTFNLDWCAALRQLDGRTNRLLVYHW